MSNATQDLIEVLTARLTPIAPRLLERRLAFAALAGGSLVLVLVAGLLGLRADLNTAVTGANFWMKLIYTSTLAALGLAAAYRLARPEQSTVNGRLLAIPVGILAALALVELLTTADAQREVAILGHTWRKCPFLIASLSLPLLAILMRLFSGFAPQRARLTGATIGLAAGGITATLYALHCPETGMTFVLLWYSAGIAIVSGIGAIAGPRFLRW